MVSLAQFLLLQVSLGILNHCAATNTDNLYDYCKKNCRIDGKFYKHAACGSKCALALSMSKVLFGYAFRYAVVDELNWLRNSGAKKLNIPNLHVLSYDMELEFVAACHIAQTGTSEVDRCPGSRKFHLVHQITFQGIYTQDPTSFRGVRVFTNYWRAQGQSVIEAVNKPDAQLPRNNFTDLLHPFFTHVGCWIGRSGRVVPCRYIVACNFAPKHGNYTDVLEKSSESSPLQCSDGEIRHDIFINLCGKIEWPQGMTHLGSYEQELRSEGVSVVKTGEEDFGRNCCRRNVSDLLGIIIFVIYSYIDRRTRIDFKMVVPGS